MKPTDGGFGSTVRQRAHDKIVDLLAELRSGEFQDNSYSPEQVTRSMRAIFDAVKSDEDLAVFLATFVGAWMRRSGVDNQILRQMVPAPIFGDKS